MVGEVGEVRVECIGVDALHGFRDRPVQRHAFATQQFGKDGLSRQRMPESEAVGRLLDHQLGRHQLLIAASNVELVYPG